MPELERKNPEQTSEELNRRLNNLPPDVQSTIANISSFFMEPDVHKEYLQNPAKQDSVKEQLSQLGFDEEAVDVTLRLIGFKILDEKQSKP